MMRGMNPIRPPVKSDGQMLEVQHIFATIQGEGPYAGWPAIFVRLGGCNLACAFCDTEFESFKTMNISDIVVEVVGLSRPLLNPPPKGGGKNLGKGEGKKVELIVITGGEPFRQPIEKLCDMLLAEGFTVQIETNGTLYRSLPEGVEIVCSPKNTGTGYFPVRPDLLARVNAFKFLISAHNKDYAQVPDIGQNGTIPVYVQPMDEGDAAKNAANVRLAVSLAQENGYRLSMQLHKIIGVE